MPNPEVVWAEITELFSLRGDNEYHGEPVSQAQHALQAAALAVQQNGEEPLVTSALLHDVGHLLHDLGEDIAEQGVDDRHEELGYRWLLERFGSHIAETVRLHVDAKRYLVATNPQYAARLSPASVLSLQLQGGPMNDEEQAEFRANSSHKDALRLRVMDDTAKDPSLEVPPLSAYQETVMRCVVPEDEP